MNRYIEKQFQEESNIFSLSNKLNHIAKMIELGEQDLNAKRTELEKLKLELDTLNTLNATKTETKLKERITDFLFVFLIIGMLIMAHSTKW